nr:hypothetical protein [Tanacetum cinerariifolium]
MTTSVVNNSVFMGFFEKQKLTRPNFIDWYKQLRIILSVEDNLNYLEHPIPAAPEEGQSVSSYVLKMKSYIDNQEGLGHLVTLGLGVSLILILLRNKFNSFVQNYNMYSMGKIINDFHAMLKLHEQTLAKNNAPALRAIRAGKGKNKLAYAPKPKIPPPPRGKILLRNQSIINAVIQAIRRGTDLRGSMKLKPSALSLYVGNGQCAAVEAIRSYHLSHPSGLVIVLNNFHYAPSITRGIISVSCLYDDGYVNCFMDNSIQVSRNNVVYFSVIPRDGIFEIDLSNSYANVISIYALSNKRAKSNLDSDILWHCRLRHISKKRIEKLQHDRLLNSTDHRAFEKCVPCMSGKMARKPYSHQVEMTKDLLGLIHTDEVENQLGKTIKWLCFDCGEGYTSQEFLDHLYDHGIIAHHTPPYTPQHNGVSERRNRILLDMVRSTMSQKTLPKSFWDYSLETAACILNMVPTKKVEKTPYEVHKDQHALDRMCLYINAEEHELGDLSERANYKAALLDPESDKWLNDMNVEMKFMKDNAI